MFYLDRPLFYFLIILPYCLIPSLFVHCKESILEQNKIHEKLKIIESQERQKLEDFFRLLFLNGDFAYTLFGDKPLGSIDVLFNDDFLNKKLVVYFTGWKIWQKYQHLFPPKNYCIVYYDNIKSISFFGFDIINKKKCYDVINSNLSIFKSCFIFDSIDELICKFCSHGFYSNEQEDRQKNFYLCLGLLFGYGKKSASLFEKRMQLIRSVGLNLLDLKGLNRSDIESICYLNKMKVNDVNPAIFDHNFIEELNDMENKKVFVSTTKIDNPLYPIKINGFVVFEDDPEIENLQSRNDALRKNMLDIYYSENFLEIILDRLSN